MSYDIKQTSKYTSETLLDELVVFIKQFNPVNFTSPVESTLIFQSSETFMTIKHQLMSKFENDIYFSFSQVALVNEEGKLLEKFIKQPNRELEKNFEEKYK